ncbi:hypothetical protein [Polyangium aurulentum]|uniref:hypothetical protein n=1 Tax=Polyangium aurulentum TaxID=2567896 RepID=UPI0010AEE092|nr:hypothetical protein [Polyangium aurulentum]UQA60338.1 hypothetical protein E8A73_007650 [Polyangium aurulentum]
MPRLADRSCYVLELSVQPGGSRWAETHTYSDPAHIRAWLEVFCSNDSGFSAYHAIWYGATLGIWIVQAGDVVDFIDVYPHIFARLGDAPPVPLADDAGCRTLVRAWRKSDAEEEGNEEVEQDDDEYDDEDFATYESMKLELDWEAIASKLPPLVEPRIMPGQATRIRLSKTLPEVASYLEDDSIEFGSYEHESGEELEPPFSLPASNEDDDEDEETED